MRKKKEVISTVLIAALAAILVAIPQCRRSTPSESVTPQPTPLRVEPRLHFPEDLNVVDNSVNEFVSHAMLTATSGDYEAFRLLWSAREEPMPREEFLQGWDAVKQVRVRALEKIMISADETPAGFSGTDMYAVYVEVSLDPTHRAAQEKANREAILVMARESDRWAVMRAPKAVRDWLRGKVISDQNMGQAAVPPVDPKETP